MTTGEKGGLAGVVVLLTVAAVLGVSYVQEREDRMRAQYETQAIQREIKARDDGRKERDETADAKMAELTAKAARVRTPQQALQAMPDVAQLPAAIYEEKDPNLPDAPSKFVLPAESVVPLYQQLAKCQVDAVDLTRCQANVKDADLTRKDLEQQRDKWKAAAQGGTKWMRVKRGAKWLGIGILVGGGAALAMKH